jgi:hypothetical protein
MESPERILSGGGSGGVPQPLPFQWWGKGVVSKDNLLKLTKQIVFKKKKW